MKANPKSGELTLPGGTILSPHLTRSSFLSSVEGAQAKVNVRNEPWCSFHFEAREDSLGFVVVFRGEHLKSVGLSINHPKFGSGWEEWIEYDCHSLFRQYGEQEVI